MANSDENPSDADLVRAVCGGETEAYGRIVDRYLKAVYSVAVRILCDATAAEDVAQDVFVRAFKRLYLYDMNHPFRNWLMKIATNQSLNYLRSRHRERVFHLRLAEGRSEPAEEPVTKDPLPDHADWQRWLGRLEESQRAAIVLYHFHDMPYADIAEVLDVPVNTVRTYLHRGRRRLREIMTAGACREDDSWSVATQNG